MDDNDYVRIAALAKKVGASFCRKYPGIDAEDIAQEATVSFLENVETIENRNDAWIKTALIHAAKSYCNQERIDYMYYRSAYVYTPDEVRKLLDTAYSSGYSSFDNPGPEDSGELVDAGDVVIGVFDLLSVLGKLRRPDRALLEKRHIGHELSGAELRKYYRAVDALVQKLNRHINLPNKNYEGPGARRVISNAHAQAITGNEY